MSDFSIMAAVTATYTPQGNQTFRCSGNFQDWKNPPAGGSLQIQVIVPEGYPQPTFAIEHDKTGKDTRWYSDVYNGLTISDIQGDPDDSYNLYVGTTSQLPKGLDGSTQYAVIISSSNGD